MIKFLFACFFSSLVFAQNFPVNIYFIADTIEQNSSSTSLAKPLNGWKAFYDQIHYPFYAYNNDMESSFDLTINIDAKGNVTKIYSYGDDDRTVFLNSVSEYIFDTKWSSATSNGIKTESKITIQFLFYIRRYNNPFPLIIEGNQASVLNSTSYDVLNNVSNSIIDSIIKARDSIYYFNQNLECCNEYSTPSPVSGFDTLKSFASNPLFLKYGVANVKLFNVCFNELGEVDSVYYTDYFQALINKFAEELQKIKWLAAKKNNKNIRSCLSIPLVYYSKDHKSVYPIIVEAIKCGAL